MFFGPRKADLFEQVIHLDLAVFSIYVHRLGSLFKGTSY